MADGSTDPVFIADAIGLDFLNSIATPVDEVVEFIGTGEDFLAWLGRAGAVPAPVLKYFAQNASPEELDAIAAQARTLREWFRDFVHRHRGKPLAAGAIKELEPLNRILASDEEYGQIVLADDHHAHDHDGCAHGALMWKPQRRWRSVDTLLLPIARGMAELITEQDFTLVKACQGHDCTLVFVDRSHRRARRWCDMAICGNRTKQNASRARRGPKPRTRRQAVADAS